jgi:hypothetical protein
MQDLCLPKTGNAILGWHYILNGEHINLVYNFAGFFEMINSPR